MVDESQGLDPFSRLLTEHKAWTTRLYRGSLFSFDLSGENKEGSRTLEERRAYINNLPRSMQPADSMPDPEYKPCLYYY